MAWGTHVALRRLGFMRAATRDASQPARMAFFGPGRAYVMPQAFGRGEHRRGGAEHALLVRMRGRFHSLQIPRPADRKLHIAGDSVFVTHRGQPERRSLASAGLMICCNPLEGASIGGGAPSVVSTE